MLNAISEALLCHKLVLANKFQWVAFNSSAAVTDKYCRPNHGYYSEPVTYEEKGSPVLLCMPFEGVSSRVNVVTAEINGSVLQYCEGLPIKATNTAFPKE